MRVVFRYTALSFGHAKINFCATLARYVVATEYLFGHRILVRLPRKFPRLLAPHPI